MPEVGVELLPQAIDNMEKVTENRGQVPRSATPGGLYGSNSLPPAQSVSTALVPASKPAISNRRSVTLNIASRAQFCAIRSHTGRVQMSTPSP